MPKKYEVEEGDTLSEIAEKETGDSSAWEDFEGVSDEVREDPTKLQPGTELEIPDQEDDDEEEDTEEEDTEEEDTEEEDTEEEDTEEDNLIEDGVANGEELVDDETPDLETVEETPSEDTEDRADRLSSRTSPEEELAKIGEDFQDMTDTFEDERDKTADEREELTSELERAYEESDSMEDFVRREREMMNVDTTIQEQKAVINDLNRLRNKSSELMERRDAALGMAEQSAVSTPFQTGEQNRIAKAYDKRIERNNSLLGEKQAYLKSLQGQVEQARGLVSDVVEAKTYDTRQELEKVNDFLDLNKEELDRLDTEYYNSIKETKDYWEEELEREQEEIDTVMNLMIEYPESGVNSDDSLEDALNKTREQLEIEPDEDVKELMKEYPDAEIEEDDSFSAAVKKVAQVPEEDDYEVRTLGDELYRVNATTGESELLAQGTGATPDSYLEWQLAGQPGEYQDWVSDETATDYLSKSQVNRMAEKGVPESTALEVAKMLRDGEIPAAEEGSELEEQIKVIREEMGKDSSATTEENINKLIENLD